MMSWQGEKNFSKFSRSHSDGSGSRVKNFNPGRVGSAIYDLGLDLENFPYNCQIFEFFFTSGQKNLFGLGHKVPGSKAGQKQARVGSGPISRSQGGP